LLSGLTATDKIEFSTNADFALTTHAGTGDDYASRVIFFGVKLTDEAISGSTGGDNTGGDDNTGDDNTGGSTGEIQTLTVKDFLAKGVDANVWYKLTGKITNIANTTYGNFDLVDDSGSVYVYGLTATQQSSNDKSFSSLGLKEGDIVTLIGVRAVYNDSPQVGNAYYVSHVEGETPEVDTNVATISFADAANRTTLTKAQQVWQQNGITVTGDKASSTTDVADYSGPARFYKGSNLTIAAEKEMSQIVINTTGGSKYYFTLSDGSGYTVSGSGTSKATITLTTPAKSFTITGLANQVRCTSIEVTFAE
jgi:RPA family protein